jgi:hypothetical protein
MAEEGRNEFQLFLKIRISIPKSQSYSYTFIFNDFNKNDFT